MSHYTITPLAAADLDNIYQYIASDNLVAAGKLLERYTEIFQKLAVVPGLGRNRPELGRGIKSFPTESYIIFYRVVEGGIQILRVLHGARDIQKIFTQNYNQSDA